MNQKFRLSPSTIAAYFKHRCDRLYRWESVHQPDRGRPGIGWNVPRQPNYHSRPGIALLTEGGDVFEIDQLAALQQQHGPGQLLHYGLETEGDRQRVRPWPMPELAETLRQPAPPRFCAQILIDLENLPGGAAGFLARFGLDGARVTVGTGRPDLLEIIPGPRPRLRVWDFKASQSARHEHFVQVAFYSLLLEHALPAVGLSEYDVDTQHGLIFSREGPDEFELAPYRLAVEDFLRHRLMPLLLTEASAAHYHVSEGCPMCRYHDTCRAEADAGRDLSRVAYMTSASKRRLARAGLPTHRDLARLTEDDPRWERLRAAGHDLSMNLGRYVAVAQALEDGRPRPLHARSLTVPAREDVRVVLSAEQDPVTNTCFALGLKTTEWVGDGGDDGRQTTDHGRQTTDDGEGARGQGPGAKEESPPYSGRGLSSVVRRPRGVEHVFLLDDPRAMPDAEARMLLAFLRQLNGLLLRVDAENAALAAALDESDTPEVAAARRALAEVTATLDDLTARYPSMRKAEHAPLRRQRDDLRAAKKAAEGALKTAQQDAWRENRRRQKRLHFYLYDGYDLTVLKRLVERHLFSAGPELLVELYTLVRLFPPESILPDADAFRSVPGTIVAQALRQLVALPTPYVYDLRAVTDLLPASNGREPYRFRQSNAFVPRGTNQIAFERIHDVWKGQSFQPNPREPGLIGPDEIRRRLERAVRDKLRATDAVVQWLQRDYRDSLLLRKEPFRLAATFDPLGFQTLEALRVFTVLEASQAELAVKHLHTLPIADRVARFECIGGLRYIAGADEPDGGLWFTFDRAARDVKFGRGDFDLVLTPQDAPERLVGELDGPLFNSSIWRYAPYKVTLANYDLAADPPRVCLVPANPRTFSEKVDLTLVQTLDRVHTDLNTPKVLEVLDRLRAAPESARHVHELLDSAATSGWRPLIGDVAAVEDDLRRRALGSGATNFLTAAQTRAFRGAPAAPLSLIWGPPGTGKTFMLAHLLLGYVLAAHRAGRPLRVLVSAFTHNAINNVLVKLADLLPVYGLGGQAAVVKVVGNQEHGDNARLPAAVERVHHKALPGLLAGDTPCLIAGSTVWGVYNAMKEAGGAVQPWFDVVLIDEASQMKLPDALIAFSASRPDGAIILAGDDRQLPPIIHGDYPDEHAHLLTSVFAYMRERIEERTEREPDFEARTIFQLEENFRMNDPLTAYPARMLYQDRFYSQQRDIRITTCPPLAAGSDDPIDFMLHPDRPVVLVRYAAPVSFTARNPLEADLAARLAARLAEIMARPGDGTVGDADYFAADGFAVLAPHRAQNSAIRAALAERGFGADDRPMPLVDTVDKLQGQERDVVVVSYGVADEEYAEAEAAFLLSSNRFNVAATRPRRKLIVLCSDAVLDVVPQDRDALLEAMMLKEFRGFCDGGPRRFEWETGEYGPVSLSIQWKAFE